MLQPTDRRLIEAGFPCHQVGAETKRERDTGQAPPTHRLHVWWARRPLTPSRAAILASLLPADTDPDWFLRQLGIERVEALVGGVAWYIPEKLLLDAEWKNENEGFLPLSENVQKALEAEQERRKERRSLIEKLIAGDTSLAQHPVMMRWQEEVVSLKQPEGQVDLPLRKIAADPAHANERILFKEHPIAKEYGLQWDNCELYGYGRAFAAPPIALPAEYTVLDPTAGGGSIPFEARRLGCKVVANDLNPVASLILQATLDYPFTYGQKLVKDIKRWGALLLNHLNSELSPFDNRVSVLPDIERHFLERHLKAYPELMREYDTQEIIDFLYVRQVTCPNCLGEAPLLNSSWLSKSGDKWGVKVITDGRERNGKVWFETYRIKGTRGPNGEDPSLATVVRGVGTCVHCGQQISADEIKAQARGESPLGRWQDRLYTVVAIRYQPKLDKQGRVQYYKSGARAGEVRTEKIRFFRPANATDLAALQAAERRLAEKWDEWESVGLIPTERFPEGNDMRPAIYGMTRWHEMFTPRQLLGHLTLVEELNRLKPQILEELGADRGKAVVTYLQFMIDKGVDYNSRQTRWEYTRGIVKGTFGRHDFSLKWTFGEMIFTGANSGAHWALSQVLDAYAGIAQLAPDMPAGDQSGINLRILHGSAANLNLASRSVDLVCMDPPYYNNVQYAELSDYFYVWQKRTLSDLYPQLFRRHLTNKQDEAVANPARDGSSKQSVAAYERLMAEIFTECHRVLKDDGLLTLMFTHKTAEAWEALTRSLVESGWVITSSFPVESEAAQSMHQKDMAAAASSVFLSCRKRVRQAEEPSSWVAFGGQGVATQIRQAVEQGLEEFAQLSLNPVDEMVACYGRALHILSENWPVMDGDELVSPLRAMNEASLVVAEHQLQKLTQGRVQVADLNPEAAMALTILGIYGFNELPYDDALNLSRSLRITLDAKTGGYQIGERMIGYNQRVSKGRGLRGEGYFAPLIRQRSKLQLATPAERAKARLDNPQTEWDVLQGLIAAYHEGDIPVARAYLGQHAAGRENLYLDLLHVWALHEENEMERKRINNLIFGLKL